MDINVFSKKEIFSELLKYGKVNVAVVVVGDEIKVPLDHVNNNIIILAFSLKFKLPLFQILDRGIYASLKFSGQDELVFLPWRNILFMKVNDIEYDFHKNTYSWQTEHFSERPPKEPLRKLQLISFNPEITPLPSTAKLKLLPELTPTPSSEPPTPQAA